MSENLGLGTMTGEHEKPTMEESPNTKIHGEPEAAPMPGVEREEPAKVKEEVNPNTE